MPTMNHPKQLYVYDARNVWHGPLIEAAKSRGWKAERLDRSVIDTPGLYPGYGFFRPHPAHMCRDLDVWDFLYANVRMVQDIDQVVFYDNKLGQYDKWNSLLPHTREFRDIAHALDFTPQFPIVSKAKQGASSVNVRIINNRDEYERHIQQAFGDGIPVSYCADGKMTTQKGYVLLQRFIPHDITYRVNIIGERMAIFERHNYPDKPVAQTGNTNGVMELTPLHKSLLEYAEYVGKEIGSKWVALDILKDGDEWKLLETSLAWPWTATDYSDVPFTGGGKWGDMWHVLLEQVEDGVFD